MTRVTPAAPPEPPAQAPARPLTQAERAAQDARKREVLQRRKAAGYGVPGGPPNTITK